VEYLDFFLTEAVSAALSAEWDVEYRYESARVLTTVTSHVWGLLPYHGISVSPSGRLPSSLARPTGSLVTGTLAGAGNDVINGPMPGYFTGACLNTEP